MSRETEISRWQVLMKACLERLGNPPEAQIAYIRELDVGEIADELALEFDDVLRPLAALLEQEPKTGEDLLSSLRSIDRALDNDNLGWSFEDLASSPAWGEIRRLAQEALRALRG